MKTIQGKIPAITIVCLLLMISACQTTSNQSRGVKSDKDSGLSEKALSNKPQSPLHQKELASQVQKEEKTYSSEALKKRDIRRSGDRITPKKQTETPPVTITDKIRKQMIRDAKRAAKEHRYRDVITITDAILKARPYDGTAQALRENAQALLEDIRHKKVIAKIEQVDTQERNRYFEDLKEKSIPYNDLVNYTDEDEWKGIKGRTERDDPEKRLEENREHTERLKLAPSPSQKPIPQEMQMKLEERLSIEFIDTPLRDVISFLQEKSKMNFFLDKDAPNTSVNIKLSNVPLSVILEYILPKDLGYVVKGNIVHVTLEPLELRVYDVRDLLINLEDRKSLTTQAETTSVEEEGTSTGEGKDTFDRVQEIIDLVTNTIEPASWSANGGKGMIAAREGMLGDIVITHILDVHKEVEGLLAALRSSADLQIAIEARFIKVSNNFLEAFGHNINDLDTTQGADDIKRRGIFTDDGKFIDTGTTSALGATTGLNLTYQIFDGLFLKGFLKAVQESEEAETVTAPKITLSNTQRGTIKVVTTLSYVKSFTIVSQTPEPVMAEIDSGTTFNVRPVVSADRQYVYLEVHPVITTVDLTPFTTFQTVGDGDGAEIASNTIQRPSTTKQELSVTVCVPDKGILMIGGLGSSDENKTSKGVPILSKIPIVKRLFSSDVMDRDITEAGNLVILIKPTILKRDEQEARAFAREKGDAEIRAPTYGR
ncbi:MAG: Type 3 secretion system secretin [Candidatus Scalindua arabica]|uniref:Type 3 secretion system secretin n=1 Tax=Candidatus Scalindua arabica TaxID=1127984 RepID=A0A941W5Q6_9BACT|nr:Type 3 secretion system secretin [Candidatus Scalindua arabica]